MDTRVFCVFNAARRVFLSSKVTVADGASQPLKVLKVMVSGLALDAESGLWLTPISSTHAVPRLFPFDIAYLDAEHRVLETVEMLPGVDFPPYRREFASAVVLPLNTLRFTQTRRSDQLIVCLQEEASELISSTEGNSAASAVAGDWRPEKPLLTPAEKTRLAEPSPQVAALGHSVAALETVPVAVEATAVAAGGVLVEDLRPLEEVPAEVAAEPPIAEKPRLMSITEVVIEKTQISSSHSVAGHLGVEDLFANWVESPAAPPSWIAQKAKSDAGPSATHAKEVAPISASEPAIPANKVSEAASVATERMMEADRSLLTSEKLAIEAGKIDMASVQDGAQGATQTPKAVDKADSSEGGAVSKAKELPLKPAVPVVVSRPAPAHTFTVAQYGMWQVSTPSTTSLGTPTRQTAAEASAKPASKPAKSAEKAEVEQLSGKTPESPSKPEPQIVRNAPFPSAKSRTEPPVAAKMQVEGRHEAKTTAGAELPKAHESETGSVPEAGRADEISRVAIPPAKRERAFAMGVSDWRTHRIVEATGKPVSAEFARAVQDKLEKLQTRGSAPQASKPAEKPEVVLEKKLEAALEKKSEAAPIQGAEATPTKKPEAAIEKKPVFAKAKPPAEAAPAPQVTVAAPEQKESVASRQSELAITLPLPGFLKPKPDEKSKLKISVQRVEANGKNGKQADSFGVKFKRWLNPPPTTNSDRRRAHRRYVPGMVAHYFTGGAPNPYEVADISMTGFYLMTEDRWMPGTMIQMTLQKPCPKGQRKQSITVLSRVVRRGSDGVAAEFVMAEGLDPQSRDLLPTQATDRFSLARFI
jgi:hypothetical protein